MKRLLSAVGTAVFMGSLLTAIPVSAVSDHDFSYHETAFETSAFRYTSGRYGITLETELTDANFMVCSVCRDEQGHVDRIQVTSINMRTNGSGAPGSGGRSGFICSPSSLEEVLVGCELDEIQIGDLLYADISGTVDLIPVRYEVEQVHWLGHGTDVLGEAFQRVIRHEQINEPIWGTIPEGCTYDTVPVIAGDVNEDETLTILDVISLNKYLMGSARYLPCQKLSADVDGNGEIDATDSLNILKYVVEIITTFQ